VGTTTRTHSRPPLSEEERQDPRLSTGHRSRTRRRPFKGEYVPQYARITSILGEATSEHEFQTFQAYLVAMADCGREIFEGQGPNMELRDADPLALRVKASIARSSIGAGWRRTAKSSRTAPVTEAGSVTNTGG
jgi:hypothetical protein